MERLREKNLCFETEADSRLLLLRRPTSYLRYLWLFLPVKRPTINLPWSIGSTAKLCLPTRRPCVSTSSS